MPDRPNILWICSDQQRFDTLGCYGNSFVKTPNLDRLGQSGVVFLNAFAQNSLCTPSRGSFLTGRYPSTNRLRQNGQVRPPDIRPITKTLDEAGYVCGLSGKFHLSNCDARLTLGPEWWREDSKKFFRGAEKKFDDGYHVYRWCHSAKFDDPCSDYSRWLHEQGVHPDRKPREDCPHVMQAVDGEHHQTTWCVNEAITFVEQMADSPYPWLFSVNMFDPHPVWDPPEDYLQPYLDKLDRIPLPNYIEGELANKPAFQNAPHPKWLEMSEKDHRMVRAAYWAMVDHLDVQIGRLLDALEASGQAENTIVLFHSDHGELLGDHGCYPKGPRLYDPAIHVPLLISWPGTIEAGRVAEGLVELTDLAPTLHDAIGLEEDPAMQGRSLWAELTGQAPLDHIRPDILCEYHNSNPHKEPIFETLLRTETHKLTRHHGTGDGELYDLQADPGENRNLWHDPSATQIKLELMTRLSDRMAFTADPMPPRIGVF